MTLLASASQNFLEFPEFLSKLKPELKIINAIWSHSPQSSLIRIKEVRDTIRYCIKEILSRPSFKIFSTLLSPALSNWERASYLLIF